MAALRVAPLQQVLRLTADGGSEETTGKEVVAPILVINPRTDADFVAHAQDALRDAASAEDLEHALRTRYPHAVVRPRELDGERTQVWYVYREGRWMPPTQGGEEANR
jgi:hypothetical protein